MLSRSRVIGLLLAIAAFAGLVLVAFGGHGPQARYPSVAEPEQSLVEPSDQTLVPPEGSAGGADLPAAALPPPDQPAYATAARVQLDTGTILYLVPTRMRVREAERVVARISAATVDEVADELERDLPPVEAEPVIEELPVGWEMKAELKADPDQFAVTEFGDAHKLLPPVGYREWQWQVIPKAAGSHSLVLVTTVVSDGIDQADGRWERTITVAVNPSHWLATNWGQLLGALGITGVGFVSFVRSQVRRQRRPLARRPHRARRRGRPAAAGVAFRGHDRHPSAA